MSDCSSRPAQGSKSTESRRGLPVLSRRGFLALSSITSIAVLTGCGGGDSFVPFSSTVDKTTMYRLSTRNVSGASNAAKSHAANKRFSTAEAAAMNRAHDGDNSRVVSLDVSETTWESYFGAGTDMVDLRQI